MNNANYDRLKDALGAICGIALFVTFFLAVGTAGAVECDNLTLADGVKRMAILSYYGPLSNWHFKDGKR